ncbi:hypothetical protein [Methanolobus profundi]|uniref:Uncharacterized protein n=1 Tax=Methanolobus profundi TaxID=487685 RepID=A0A1I4RCH9_9EURY|nr:hypothetical protein [Methanolobus profundi]SFM49670.1 hypothetical protein SAMN04488696_1485 [Methanolobus profundi]
MVSREPTKWISSQKDKEKNNERRLSFALSLIGFCFVIVYTIIPEIYSNYLDYATERALNMTNIFVYTIGLSLAMYIFCTGLSLNSQINSKANSYLVRFSSHLYESCFHLIIVAPIMIISSYIAFKPGFLNIIGLLLLIAGATLFIVAGQKVFDNNIDGMTVFVIFLSIGGLTSQYVAHSNDIEITMENVHELGNSPIPIDVKVTGREGNLTVMLYEKNGSILSLAETLSFDADKPRIMEKSEHISGIHLHDGIYNIYIDTTDMNPEIYGLTFKINNHSEFESFQLLGQLRSNTSKMSNYSFDINSSQSKTTGDNGIQYEVVE